MKAKLIFFGVLIVSGISACGTIKEFFPDKEKDYQFTTEIPPLKIPEDLSEEKIQNKPIVKVNQQSAETELENQEPETKQKELLINVDLVEYIGGTTRIQIEDTIKRSWYYVGKAISRNSIEIIKRKENQKEYLVQYDPNFKKVEDGSLWDELLFVFAEDPAQEKEYKIKLSEKAGMTEVFLLDIDNNTLSNKEDLPLLDLLYRTIKTDLSR